MMFILNITYFILYIYINVFIFYHYTHTLHLSALFLHFWLDAKLHYVMSVLVLCAMTIKLNVILYYT